MLAASSSRLTPERLLTASVADEFTACCADAFACACWVCAPTWLMRELEAPDSETLPPLSVLLLSPSTMAKRLALSPGLPALLLTVKLSPVAGVPLIDVVQPLAEI